MAIDNNIRCGFCSFCRMGLSSQCVEIKFNALGVMRDGGYAEYCVVPEKQCFALPDEIDDVLGSQVETLATVVNGMNTLQMLPYDYVMILGFGPIGYLFAQFAKNIAAKVAVTEIDPFRISVAKECGLTVWNPNEVDVVEKITEFTYGRKADIVIEATGNALGQALKCVTPGGKVLPFGMDSSVHHRRDAERDHALGDQDPGPLPGPEHDGALDPHLPGEPAEHEAVLHQGDPAGGWAWRRSAIWAWTSRPWRTGRRTR